MHRLVLSKLYDAAAILPGKIDARLRQIAALVNGGLASDSLTPAYKIPQAGFREGSSQFVLGARYTEIPGAGPVAVLAAVPVDSFLLWAELRVFAPMGTLTFADLRSGTYPGLFENFGETGSVPRATLPGSGDIALTATWDFRSAPKAVAAGRQVWAAYVGAITAPRGVLTAIFKAAHQA